MADTAAPPHTTGMKTLNLARQDMATAAETKFLNWLDASKAAYLYIDQTQATFAADFRGSTKRPDFLVGIPAIGTIAVDVKAKSATNSTFFIDAEEHDRMAQFEFAFGVPVWFAILRADTTAVYLIANASVGGYPRVTTEAGDACAILYDEFYRCNPNRCTFYGALYEATCLGK